MSKKFTKFRQFNTKLNVATYLVTLPKFGKVENGIEVNMPILLYFSPFFLRDITLFSDRDITLFEV